MMNTKSKKIFDAAQKANKEYSLFEKIPAIFRMISATMTKKYTMKTKTILFLVGGIVYLFIPEPTDLIPFLGWLDEVAVLGFVLKAVFSELDRFLTWEHTHKSTQIIDIEAEIEK